MSRRRAPPSIGVKGGRVDLVMDNGRTLVLPSDYGMLHDATGASLDKCSLFFAPVVVTGEPVTEIDPETRKWFGEDYELRAASVDLPAHGWELQGHVASIVYFRPGEFEDDWRHDFSEPQPLRSADNADGARCYWLEMPADCVLTWKGIESP